MLLFLFFCIDKSHILPYFIIFCGCSTIFLDIAANSIVMYIIVVTVNLLLEMNKPFNTKVCFSILHINKSHFTQFIFLGGVVLLSGTAIMLFHNLHKQMTYFTIQHDDFFEGEGCCHKHDIFYHILLQFCCGCLCYCYRHMYTMLLLHKQDIFHPISEIVSIDLL